MPKQATGTVDTPAAEPETVVGPLPALTLPQAADVPRESAQETAAMATRIMDDVDDAAGWLATHWPDAADVRRRVAILADVVATRDLSKAATRDVLTALRIAERLLGLAMIASGTKWREVVPDQAAAFRCSALADVPQDEFIAALATLRRTAVTPTVEALLAVVRGDTPETEELDTPTVDDHSDIPPDEVAATVTAGLTYLAEAARILRRVTPEHMRALTPELAADWVRQVWDDSVPVLTLRKNLIERGND